MTTSHLRGVARPLFHSNKLVWAAVLAAVLLSLTGARPTLAATNPIGFHDGATVDTTTGWACDADNWNATLQIHFYLDGPAGAGTLIGTTTANRTRADVASSCGGTSQHGFDFALPASVRDGRNHTLYAYAINYGGGINPQLSLSPKTITQYAPIGFHASATGNTTTGWVCDQNNWNAALDVHFYLDFPAGQGTLIGTTTANRTRADVASSCGGTSNHGFEFALPASVRDGRNHTLYAYAIDHGGGTNPQLSLSPQAIPATGPAQANKLVDSSNNSYGYAYAPSIIQLNGTYHMFYCSLGTGIGAWDFIRYATSTDGTTWSTPQIVLTVSDSVNERAACDPSVVFYNNYYYLFYTGSQANVQGVMFVARASAIGGPYYKYTNRGTWEINPTDPKIIIAPRNAIPEGQTAFYGAGQQTVVVANGQLHLWYYDDTLSYPLHQAKLLYTTASSPTNWAPTVETNLAGTSVDVKYDPTLGRFVMADIEGDSQPNAQLMRYVSTNGINWSGSVFKNADSFPDYVHNVGISGDRAGQLLAYTLIGFGAPYDLSVQYRNECQTSNPAGPGYFPNYCWGYWDMYGMGTTTFK